MKARVLMNKKTGHLMEAYRVCFIDQDWKDDLVQNDVIWTIGVLRHDGWVVKVPADVCPAPLFFNADGVTEMFEDLGEL